MYPPQPLRTSPPWTNPSPSSRTPKVPTTEIFLAPGQAKLGAQLGSETPVLTSWSSGKWTILEKQADFEGRRKQIASSFDAQPIITLNEGDYKLRVKVGDATQETDLTVKEGEQKVVEVDVTAER